MNFVLCFFVAMYALSAQSQTFQITGKIEGPAGSEVTFQSKNFRRTVITNQQLTYHTVLPVGSYTMTVRQSFFPLLQDFHRPIFDVPKPTILVLNGGLYPARISCDLVWSTSPTAPSPTPEQWEERTRNVCGGIDIFPLPSKDAVPFELYIRYLRRRIGDGVRVYMGDEVAVGVMLPVFVEYNLFTLQANTVEYDPSTGMAHANGQVIVTSPSGVEHHFDSLRVKLADGKAIPILEDSVPK